MFLPSALKIALLPENSSFSIQLLMNTLAGNERSKRVQEKLGFTYVRTDPKGDTLLGYTLPEIENVLWRSDFEEKDKNR